MQYVEVLGKIKPKNFANGGFFHIADSGDINFNFDSNAYYQSQSLVLYNGNWFVRNNTQAGYNTGTLPTDTDFFKSLNPGRDLGHFDTLEDLETAYPSPNPGSIATYGNETAFVKWNGTSESYEEVKSGGGERGFWVNSDLDTVSAPQTFKGQKTVDDGVTLPPEIEAYSFLASTDGDTYTSLADITALNNWITANISTDSTVWQLKVVAEFGSGNSGEVQIVLSIA